MPPAARRRTLATAGLATWAALTGAFAYERIAPGPRTPGEVCTMLATSVAIPPAAVWHWLRGWMHVIRAGAAPPDTAAVLFDRDGTLITDVPYNGDASKVQLRAGAREALAMVRAAGIPTAVVSNQSGVARGLVTPGQVAAVNHRIEELLGPLGPWCVCPHDPAAGCGCRKPRPGLIRDAARLLGVDVRRCVVIGDIGSDVQAARAAGARSVLVPTAVTRPDEIAAAPVVANDLIHAVELALAGAAT
jgi:histidinol-phosphate phosphatase family protein